MSAGRGRIYQVESAPKARTAIVFGAAVSAEGHVSWPLQYRLEAARDLYSRGLVSYILVSGDNSRKSYNESDAMKRWLVQAGVPEQRVACDYAGHRTLDSCARAARLWRLRDGVILVSQNYHLPRALYLAKAWGMDATAVAARSGTYRHDRKREFLARVKAWLDINVLRTEPALWGPEEHWPGEEAGV